MSVDTNSLSQYLEQLQGTTFRKLYQQPSTALAIFRRMLPHLGKRASFYRSKNTFTQAKITANGKKQPRLL